MINSISNQVVTNQAGLALALNRAWSSRSRRVLILVMGIIVLSMADLAITLAYLRAHWMMEANPIAAFLIKYTQSPWSLACYKALTVLVCVVLLVRLRQHKAGELAAWCALAILGVMSVMWHTYSQHFDDADNLVVAQVSSMDDGRLGLP